MWSTALHTCRGVHKNQADWEWLRRCFISPSTVKCCSEWRSCNSSVPVVVFRTIRIQKKEAGVCLSIPAPATTTYKSKCDLFVAFLTAHKLMHTYKWNERPLGVLGWRTRGTVKHWLVIVSLLMRFQHFSWWEGGRSKKEKKLCVSLPSTSRVPYLFFFILLVSWSECPVLNKEKKNPKHVINITPTCSHCL